MCHTAIWIALACLQAPGTPAAGVRAQDAAHQQPAAASALRPGELPADTSPEARALWTRLVEAAGTSADPVTAFDLTFDGRARSKERQSNDFNKTRYRYMAPAYVRVTFKSGVEHMRGPQGDWLVDPKADRGKADIVELRGRDYLEDKKQLSETLSIGRNFVALTDPSRLRIRGMQRLEQGPSSIPSSLVGATAGLQWLQVDSPDFYLLQRDKRPAGAPAPTFRALMGLNPNTGLPAVAIIYEVRERNAMVHETAVLVQLSDFRDLDGFRVPFRVATHALDAKQNGLRFTEKADLELWLLAQGASLRPELTERDFLPQQ